MGIVYILRLSNQKWYVGFTRDLEHRLEVHKNGEGASWTKLHKPIQLTAVVYGDKSTERQITLDLMIEYGWENVRGSAWTNCNLNKPPIPIRA